MPTSLVALLVLLRSLIRSRVDLQLENLALRHQIGVLQRSVKNRTKLTPMDRLLWVSLSRIWRDWRSALAIVKPETVVAWHHKGFCLFWAWKVRHGRPGRPAIARETRDLIRRMCHENPSWGAPRIHGELLKLGFEIAQMVKQHGAPSQAWRAFLLNHAPDIAAMDLFVVPTIGFKLLYGLIIVRLARRRLVWVAVTANPTARPYRRGRRSALARDSRRLRRLL